jgi:hypothetical protein
MNVITIRVSNTEAIRVGSGKLESSVQRATREDGIWYREFNGVLDGIEGMLVALHERGADPAALEEATLTTLEAAANNLL